MDIRDRSVEAIVLKSTAYKEQDRLLTFITPEYGVEKAIARGAAKSTGSLRPIAQPYARVSLLLTPRRGLSFVSQGEPLETYIRLDSGLKRFTYGAYVAELAILASPEQKPALDLYYLLQAVFSLLSMDEDLDRTLRFYELRFLDILGVLPEMTGCSLCGRSVANSRFLFSPLDGRLLCAACGANLGGPRLSAGAVMTLRRMLTQPFSKLPALHLTPAMNQELETALGFVLEQHLDRSSKVRRLLHTLCETE